MVYVFSVSALADWKINRKARAIRCNDVKMTDKSRIFLKEFVFPAFTFFTDFQSTAVRKNEVIVLAFFTNFRYKLSALRKLFL